MSPKTRVFLTLIGLAFLDTIMPIPLVACILISVVLQRPTWFTAMVCNIYGPWQGSYAHDRVKVDAVHADTMTTLRVFFIKRQG